MPFYFSDYLADTGHLSTVEHGAYLLLMAHYWAHGCLPNDETTIARITRMTPRQWSQSRDVLRSLFVDNWRHKRIDKELGKAIEKSNINSANARRRHSDRSSNVERSETQPEPQSQYNERERDARAREAAESTSVQKMHKTPDAFDAIVPRETSKIATSPLITSEAISIAAELLKFANLTFDDPNGNSLAYTTQAWLNIGCTRDFILSRGASVIGRRQKFPHVNYLDSAIRNGWNEQQSAPQNVRKIDGKTPTNSPVQGWQNSRDKFRAAHAKLKEHIQSEGEREINSSEGYGGPPLRLASPA
jgi:uncharacterized protein YdaU (DUF1376 family)